MILLQKLVVGEVAVRLGQGRLSNRPVYLTKDPTPANEDLVGHRCIYPHQAYLSAIVSSSIDACMLAVKIVDNRYVGFLSVFVPVLIADGFSNQLVCLERGSRTDMDLT
jgi:hypothetical protein